MNLPIETVQTQLIRLIHFLVATLRKFRDNNAFLLAGSVGYATLLSIIPLFIVLLVVLSHFFDQQQIIAAINRELHFVVPGHADWLTTSIRSFVEQRDVVGGVVIGLLLFFSSIAFRTFEGAMEVIFESEGSDRHFLVSFLLPYGFMLLLAISLVGLSAVTVILEGLSGRTLELFGRVLVFPAISGPILYVISFLGLTAVFTAVYKVVPAARVELSRAAIGAVFASVLWEITRRFMVWYFSNIAQVNVVYGSLTTVIVTLLTMEVAAVIVLLGAQVIAQLEHHDEQGLPWYGEIEE